MKNSSLFSSALLVAAASAQLGAYQQCGGPNWKGTTTCVSGYYCYFQSQWYSQCIPGTASTTNGAPTTTSAKTTSFSTMTTTSTTSSKTTSSTSAASSGKLKWLGINESGAEFGSGAYPGTEGKDYTFPSLSVLDSLMAEGYNIFRVPFAMERMAPNGITGSLSQSYLAKYSAVINHITAQGRYAIIDPHNYGRFNGAVITDYASFGTFWSHLAAQFSGNSNAIFDTNNEYHDEDQTLVLNMNQAAINAIRAAGATSQYIFVEGNSYTGAWTWQNVNDNMKALTDPSNKIVYEMHQYLDSDGSGTSAACVSGTIGVERVTAATAWLRANGKQGIIGEFAGGANSQCMQAVQGMLNHLQSNSDVWLGAVWWGGGPWWGNYIYGFEPPSGTAYSYYDAALKAYKP